MRSDYEILGLPENSDKAVVEKKYGALIKQYKYKTDEHGVTDEDAKYYQTITEAYNRITGRDPGNYDDNPTSVIPYPVRRFFGKLATLFDQYKLVIFILIFIVTVGIIVIVQSNTITEYDLNIKFIGSFDTLDEAAFSKKISEKSKRSETASASFYTITTSSGYTTENMNQATQFQSQLISGYLDIIIMDSEGWLAYKNQKAFLKLDDILEEKEFAQFKDKLKLIEYKQPHDEKGMATGPESGIYAIDVTETTFFDDFKDQKLEWLYDEKAGQEKCMYIAIAGTTKNVENAKKFLSEFLNY